MKNEIIKRITLSEEILSAIPKNNNKNSILYINEANKIYANYNRLKLQLIEEMKQRIKNTDNMIKDEVVESFSFDDIFNKINLLNNINTPFEKLHLDKALYNLKKYYKSNLREINNYIFEAIEIFKIVGITLKEDDFFYDEYAKAYMKELLSIDKNNYSIDVIKPFFEDCYWKSPNIINYIQLNFKYLYHKNYKSFEKYILSSTKEMNQKIDDVIKEYKDKKVEYDLILEKNSKIYFEKFLNGTYELKNYSRENVDKLINSLFEVDVSSKEKIIFKLNKTLNEYKEYLKYKALIDEVKVELQNKSKEKIDSNKKLNEILKLENQLYKLNKKKNSKKKSVSPEEIIEKIITLYDEYDKLYYKEKLFNYMNDDSKIIDGIKFIISFYEYYVKLVKENIDEITETEIEINLIELKNLMMSPYNNIINNIDILGNYNIATIIKDKYKLDNMKIEDESLKEGSLGDFIKITDTLTNYYIISNLKNINLETIQEYYKIKNLLKNAK